MYDPPPAGRLLLQHARNEALTALRDALAEQLNGYTSDVDAIADWERVFGVDAPKLIALLRTATAPRHPSPNL